MGFKGEFRQWEHLLRVALMRSCYNFATRINVTPCVMPESCEPGNFPRKKWPATLEHTSCRAGLSVDCPEKFCSTFCEQCKEGRRSASGKRGRLLRPFYRGLPRRIAALLVLSLSRWRLQPAEDLLQLWGEISVMMHHLPAPFFSAIDIRDAVLELHLLTGEGYLDAFRTYRVGQITAGADQ